MNVLSNLSETYREYALASTDDLIRFRRSKVMVTAGRRGGKGKVITLDRTLACDKQTDRQMDITTYTLPQLLCIS